MDCLNARLAENDFFSTLSATTRQAVAAECEWMCVTGGSVVYRQNEPAARVYFVLSGRLIVARRGTEGEDIIGYIGAGEPAGEMSLLLDEPHSATIYALRDTELIAINHNDFDRLIERHGDLATKISRLILRRSRPVRDLPQRSAPKVFAMIGSSPSINIDQFTEKLSHSLNELGLDTATFGEQHAENLMSEFDHAELHHDIILLTARVADSTWYRFVLRHADRFFVFTRRDAVPPKPFPLSPSEHSPARRFRMVDLIVLNEGLSACSILDWQQAINAQRIFHWRDHHASKRLARIIAGRSIGIVLSGGGARAYAHIGAVRALREAAIPIDFASGASMGAIIAACIALGWSDDEVDYRIRRAFVDSNPLADFHLPVVALTRGKLVDERLSAHFGDALIEEFDLPFFCVSADLARGDVEIHRTGLARNALRASISLPGILPPVVDEKKLLVDGGLINNFPTDIMTMTHRGPNIGIDVARRGSIDPADYTDIPGFFRWVRKNGFSAPPPIVGLLMRAASTRRESTLNYFPADIMITPTVAGVDLRSWKEYDRAVEEGYRTTCELLEKDAVLDALRGSARERPADFNVDKN